MATGDFLWKLGEEPYRYGANYSDELILKTMVEVVILKTMVEVVSLVKWRVKMENVSRRGSVEIVCLKTRI